MRLSLAAASILMLATSTVACVESESTDVGNIDAPELKAQGPGSSGTNGLVGSLFLAHQGDLIAAAGRPLVEPGSNQVVAVTGSELLSTPDGQTVFRYAVACAVAAGESVVWQGTSFTGLGHMSTSSGWGAQALSGPALLDLLACMIAHVNKNEGVPILLSGPNVSDDGLDQSGFEVDEARWIALFDEDGAVQYVVWPSPTLQTPSCATSADPLAVLNQRICGDFQGECPVLQGSEVDCTLGEDGYTCLGRPAILTTLREEDVARRFCF